jgi:hypothetical protein
VATVRIHFLDGDCRTVTELDAHQVGELATLIAAREQETFTLVGLSNFTITEHRTADVVRLEIVPDDAATER